MQDLLACMCCNNFPAKDIIKNDINNIILIHNIIYININVEALYEYPTIHSVPRINTGN